MNMAIVGQCITGIGYGVQVGTVVVVSIESQNADSRNSRMAALVVCDSVRDCAQEVSKCGPGECERGRCSFTRRFKTSFPLTYVPSPVIGCWTGCRRWASHWWRTDGERSKRSLQDRKLMPYS